MIDIQASGDTRGIAIPDVGISGLRHQVLAGDRRDQSRVIADIAVGVHLPEHRRGTHMSRLVQLVLEHDDDLTVERLPVVAKRLLSSLDAEAGRLSLAFPFLVHQPSPVTGLEAQNVHDARVEVRQQGDHLEMTAAVDVVATSLCPCSKAISDYGAHNQRSRVHISVTATGDEAAARVPALRDLVAWAEGACSCPTYPLLKRPDERHVTMQAFDHPVFVEDIVRDAAIALQSVPGPGTYRVKVVNEESIHRHDAYAEAGGVLSSPDSSAA